MPTRPWSDTLAKLNHEIVAQAKAETEAIAAPLRALRKARDFTQDTIAETLGVTQPEVSKMERRTELYISTLRRYIEAMGGSLDIVARFPSGEAVILDFAPPENVFPTEADIAVAIGDRESTPA
jgi:transcriptional regulator with XRE-family HTH domain